MASTNFSLSVVAGDGQSPITANKTQTAARLRNYFHRLLGANNLGAHTVHASAAAASAVVTCATVVNANTIAINGTTFTATQKHARGTITPTVSGIDVADTLLIHETTLTARKHHSTGTVTITIANTDADDTVTINGVVFTAKLSETLATGYFDISGTATAAATSLAACITASVDPLIAGVLTATSAAGVVTVRSVATGIATHTFVSSDADGLAVSGSGTTTAGTVPAADEFDISGSIAQCCTSIAAAIAANADLAAVVSVWTSATVVTVRALIPTDVGNYVLTSSDAQLAVSGAGTMTGGAAIANNVFDFGGTDTETAADLVRAINASTTDLVEFHVSATNAAGVVTITARSPGHAGNAITVAGTASTLVFTGSVTRLAGGTEYVFTF